MRIASKVWELFAFIFAFLINIFYICGSIYKKAKTMKKLLTFAICIGASALSPSMATAPSAIRPIQINGTATRIINTNGVKITDGTIKILPQAPADIRTMSAPAMKTSGVINTAPEGTTKLYAGSGYSVMSFGESATLAPTDGVAQEIVTCENGDIYWKNPIFALPTDTYLKGSLNGNDITLSLPQAIYEFEGNTFYAYSLKMETREDGAWFVPDTENADITMTVDPATGIITQQGDNMLGLCNANGNWIMIGQTQMKLTPFTKEVTYMPADVEAEDWGMTYTESISEASAVVKVGISGDKMYISGLHPLDEKACITADIADGKIHWDSEQYLGYYGGYFFYAYGGKKTVTESVDEDGIPTIEEHIQYQNDATFAYDADAKTITPIIDGQLIMISSGMTFPLVTYEKPYFKYQGPVTDFTPVAATGMDLWNFEEDGFNLFIFSLQPKNAQGQILDANAMSYEVYVNDELFTFTPEEYMIESPMTRIPYGFTDDMGNFSVTGAERMITLYRTDIQNLSVISYCKDADGIEHASERATYTVAGISDAATDSPVVGCIYHDLSGRIVSNPSAGIYIKEIIRADGSRQISKVSVR